MSKFVYMWLNGGRGLVYIDKFLKYRYVHYRSYAKKTRNCEICVFCYIVFFRKQVFFLKLSYLDELDLWCSDRTQILYRMQLKAYSSMKPPKKSHWRESRI